MLFRFILEYTTPFTAISLALLMIATVYTAVKHPARLHSIGTITIVFGLLCFAVSFTNVFDAFQKYPPFDYQGLVSRKMVAGELITKQDLASADSIWPHIISPLCKSCAIMFWSSILYMLSRLLYIIRTPRI